MQRPQVVPGLTIARAEGDADLEAMVAVRGESEPDHPPPRLESLRHNLATGPDLVYVVARLDGEAVACGFVNSWPPRHAEAHLVVVPRARRRGVGSAVLAALGAHALAARKEELEGEVREDDEESRRFLERRGYRTVGGAKGVALELDGVTPAEPSPPAGVRVVALAEHPELVEALYPIAVEAEEDIPGSGGVRTVEEWRAAMTRPARRADLFFVALAGDEPIGYATLEDFGRDARHGLTAVKRAWRRRGVATALKQSQIAAAKRAGFRRLFTDNEERNIAMRNLNAKLGFHLEPSLSTVVLRGPADVRWRHGDH